MRGRVGNPASGDGPADGFSIHFARVDDPVLQPWATEPGVLEVGAQHIVVHLNSIDERELNSSVSPLLYPQNSEVCCHLAPPYDALKRLVAQTKVGVSAGGYPAQAAVTNLLAFDAAGRVVTNTTAAGSLALTTVTRYDLAVTIR